MLSQALVAQRLRRFEIVANIEYLNPDEVVELWLEHFNKDYFDEKFIGICEVVEERIRWHILPTPRDFLEAEEGPAK